MSQVQTPSVGRVVHYLSRGSADGVFKPACRAAIITEVHSLEDQGITARMLADREVAEMLPAQPVVSLCVLNPSGLFFDQYLSYDEDAALGGTWHWPERVEQPYDPSQANQHGTIPRPDRTPGVDVP